MIYVDGFNTDNPEKTCPEGFSFIAVWRGITAITIRGNKIRTYDDKGGVIDWIIPKTKEVSNG